MPQRRFEQCKKNCIIGKAGHPLRVIEKNRGNCLIWLFEYLTHIPDYLSAEFVEEIASLMAAVIYMISAYPVRSRKTCSFSRFCWNAFLLGPITLRVETLIFICKRMPAYSARIGEDFFQAIEILICLKVSVNVEIIAIICVLVHFLNRSENIGRLPTSAPKTKRTHTIPQASIAVSPSACSEKVRSSAIWLS